jgi:hypothetical protein
LPHFSGRPWHSHFRHPSGKSVKASDTYPDQCQKQHQRNALPEDHRVTLDKRWPGFVQERVVRVMKVIDELRQLFVTFERIGFDGFSDGIINPGWNFPFFIQDCFVGKFFWAALVRARATSAP